MPARTGGRGGSVCLHLFEPQPRAGGVLALVGEPAPNNDSRMGFPEAVGEGEGRDEHPRRGNEIKQRSG